MVGRGHGRDLGTRVGSTHYQDGPRLKLRDAAQLARMQLENTIVQLGRERWDPRFVPGAAGDDHSLSPIRSVVGGHVEAVTTRG